MIVFSEFFLRCGELSSNSVVIRVELGCSLKHLDCKLILTTILVKCLTVGRIRLETSTNARLKPNLQRVWLFVYVPERKLDQSWSPFLNRQMLFWTPQVWQMQGHLKQIRSAFLKLTHGWILTIRVVCWVLDISTLKHCLRVQWDSSNKVPLPRFLASLALNKKKRLMVLETIKSLKTYIKGRYLLSLVSSISFHHFLLW